MEKRKMLINYKSISSVMIKSAKSGERKNSTSKSNSKSKERDESKKDTSEVTNKDLPTEEHK